MLIFSKGSFSKLETNNKESTIKKEEYLEFTKNAFVGSGTTCIAALKTERFFIGYDNNKKYVEIVRR